MGKIEKVHPIGANIVSNRIIISNQTLNDIVKVTNALVDTVNALCDKLSDYDKVKQDIQTTKDSVKALAKAIQIVQNDN